MKNTLRCGSGEYLFSIAHLSMAEQMNNLQEEFHYWKGNHPQTDDVLIIGVKL
ncbi:MAG: hypothetical protein HC880_06450 [Bacteroidia bacterium]|nr:hypothetical protein [Bacteroidia bacterium]